MGEGEEVIMTDLLHTTVQVGRGAVVDPDIVAVLASVMVAGHHRLGILEVYILCYNKK